MTPEAQRIKIAEACGWKGIVPQRWGGYTEIYQSLCSPADAIAASGKYWGYIPDYLNDLNAMHAAVASLDSTKQAAFAAALAFEAGKRDCWTHELSAYDWARCFLIALQSECVGGK